MKLHRLLIICIGVVALGLSSCSVVERSSYNPDNVQLNIGMSDLEFLGETEISVEYRKYIGVIRAIDKINGENYDGAVIRRTQVKGCTDPTLQRATYKIFEEFPEADYVVISNQKRDITRLFLGSEVTVSAKVKAYKIK